jgi:hypothetical protein
VSRKKTTCGVKKAHVPQEVGVSLYTLRQWTSGRGSKRFLPSIRRAERPGDREKATEFVAGPAGARPRPTALDRLFQLYRIP